MKLDYIKERKELISVVLSGISVLFAMLIFMRLASYFKLSARARDIKGIVQTIIARDNTRVDELNKYLSPTKEMAKSLKKSNLFTPPQEKKNPVNEVRCILGDEAFINNKWYKESEMVQDAKIVAIEPTQVTIEWDGKTKVFRPLDAPGVSSGPGERPPSGPGGTPPARSSTSPIPPPGVPGPQPGPVEGTPSGSGSVPPDIPSVIPIPPSLQGQLSDQVQERIKNEMQKMRLAIQEQNSAERD